MLAAWPAIVERLSAHPPTKPLIVRCRPVAVDGAIVTLGFPEEQAFLKEQAERRRPGIEAGIAEVIGHPVTVRCVVANVELTSTGPDDLVAEARRISRTSRSTSATSAEPCAATTDPTPTGGQQHGVGWGRLTAKDR